MINGNRILFRKLNAEELHAVSDYTISVYFSRQESSACKDVLRRIKDGEEIKWLMRAVQVGNLNGDSVHHIIEINGKAAGSVIVEREEEESRKHSASYELYLLEEFRNKESIEEIFRLVAEEIRRKWNDEIVLLNSISLPRDNILYENCGFVKEGVRIMSVLAPDGLYRDETIFRKQMY